MVEMEVEQAEIEAETIIVTETPEASVAIAESNDDLQNEMPTEELVVTEDNAPELLPDVNDETVNNVDVVDSTEAMQRCP